MQDIHPMLAVMSVTFFYGQGQIDLSGQSVHRFGGASTIFLP